MDADFDCKKASREEEEEEDEAEDEEYVYEEDAEYDEQFGDEEEELSPRAYDGDISPPAESSTDTYSSSAGKGGDADAGNDVAAATYSSPAPSLGASSTGGERLVTSSRRGSREHLRSRGPSLGSRELTIPTDNFVIADSVEVQPVMETLIDEVATLLDVSVDAAQVLLQNKRWDKEKLIEAFFGDGEKELRTAGLQHFDPVLLQQHITTLYAARERESSGGRNADLSGDKFCCRICCDPDVPAEEAFSLCCGHRFCRDCFREYLRNQLGDGQTCILAHCPEHKCNERVTSRCVNCLCSCL